MWIRKKEINRLSKEIRNAINGKNIDFRDNREGPFCVLKNDIYTLVEIKEEQKNAVQTERDQLSEYLADISHQLKTPITSMMIMTELLEDAPSDKQEEFIYNIRKSLSRMEWLVSALLKMAKLDSGAVHFSMKGTGVKELVEQAVQPLEILLDVKNQSVELLNDIQIVCDSRWTSEALSNLIKNASEHSPEAGTISIDCGQNPIYNWISVTDSGEGMKKEQYAALFKRFEYSTGQNGCGIGMPLARSIMKGQNGDIDLDFGGKGKGASFMIKLYK